MGKEVIMSDTEKKESTTTTFRLPLDLYEELRRFAFETRSSMSKVTIVALRKYLEEYNNF